MKIKKILYALRAIGAGNILRTILYSLKRDYIEKKYYLDSSNSKDIFPGDIQKINSMPSGARVVFAHATIEAQYITKGMLKISWEPGKLPLPYTIEKADCEIQSPLLEYRDHGCLLSTDQIIVFINKDGTIEFLNHHQNRLHFDQPPVRNGERWRLISNLRPEEHIFGLGERISSFNLRPGNYVSWNRDLEGKYSPGADPLYIGTPIYLSLSSSGCHLVYFENSYRSRFSFGEQASITFDGGMLRYYIIFGSMEDIFRQLSELVGKPYLPPRWALGYHQSRWGYRSEAVIRKLLKDFKDHDLPISAIHLDIDYMDGFRVFSINTARFPDMKRLAKDLEAKGVKLVATINPAVKKDRNYKVFSDGLEKNIFCQSGDGKPFTGLSWPGWAMFPDFMSSKTREWWFEQYQPLITAGISGFWHDMNEPTSFTAWGDVTLPLNTLHHNNGQAIKHKEAHNLYGLMMNKALYEGYRKHLPAKRPWIFSRSGWAGLQRYAWNWTGDIDSSWEALSHVIPSILGLALSGHAFAGVDIGGFSGDPEAELYLRWFQLATFLPLFRTHSSVGTHPREPWVYGEGTTNIIRNFLKLRYKLMPYWYTAIWDTCQTGIPAFRPIFWESVNDIKLWDVDDEFLLGENLLIAPVVRKRARRRSVVLPPGIWYSYWDGKVFVGPGQFECEVSDETIPLFVKGGSILPMEEDGNLSLHIFPLENGEATSHIYSDSGDGYETWRIDRFFSTHRQDSMRVLWESTGEYPFPYPRIKIILHGKKMCLAVADGKLLPISLDTMDTPMFHSLELEFE